MKKQVMKAQIGYNGGVIVKTEKVLKGRGITQISDANNGGKINLYKLTEKACEKIEKEYALVFDNID